MALKFYTAHCCFWTIDWIHDETWSRRLLGGLDESRQDAALPVISFLRKSLLGDLS